jgi:hypothetical protein
MGDVVDRAVGAAGDLFGGAVDTVQDITSSDLGKAALLAGGAYMAYPYLAGEAAAGGGIGSLFGGGAPELLGEASGAWASNPVGGGGFLGGALGGLSTGQALGLGAGALALSGGLGSKQPSQQTTTNAIDPEMKAAYLRNLEEARATAAGLGERQFAAFPEYSTNMVQKYMNPYQQDVIDASMADLNRQRQMQQMRDLNSATAAKAFGGSRQGVAQALTNEAYDRTAANTLANLRSQGFSQAQNLALQQEQQRQAYEQQRLDAARNLGLERLNVSQGALSLQPANIGGTQTSPIYKNTGASLLGGALGGGTLGKMIGGTANPEYAGYGALAGGLLGFL